jgi:hypothetical protein
VRPSIAEFSSLLFVALALAPSAAHLLELPNKIGLPRADYFTVQQIYRGWALLAVVVVGELISLSTLVVLVRHHAQAFAPALAALLCVVAAQVLFWTLTFPANQATQNWTVAPGNWEALRAQWEYSHAAAAVLNLVAFVALILAVLARRAPG